MITGDDSAPFLLQVNFHTPIASSVVKEVTSLETVLRIATDYIRMVIHFHSLWRGNSI